MITRLKIAAKKVRLLLQFTLIRIKARFSGSDPGRDCVLIDLSGLSINRRIVQVTLQLVNAGYTVYYRMPSRMYAQTMYDGFYDYQQFLFERARCYRPGVNYLAVFCSENNPRHYPKTIVFFDDIPGFREHYAEEFFFPILFHPLKMARDSEKTVPDRASERKIKIVFIGNNSGVYSDNEQDVHQTYGLKTRNEIIAFLCSRFNGQIFRPDSLEAFKAALNDDKDTLKNKIVIIDRFRLGSDDYWDALRKSACFIWTCGVFQPYCHNQMESIYTGTIPIAERRIVYPGIGDENAFLYNSFEELEAIVEKLLHTDIDSAEITQREEQVRKLFREHFSTEAFRQKTDRFIRSDKEKETYYICSQINAQQ